MQNNMQNMHVPFFNIQNMQNNMQNLQNNLQNMQNNIASLASSHGVQLLDLDCVGY